MKILSFVYFIVLVTLVINLLALTRDEGSLIMNQDNTDQSSITEESFWKAVTILLRKPHVVNRRIWGSRVVYRSFCLPHSLPWNIPKSCTPLASPDDVDKFIKQVLIDLNAIELHENEFPKNTLEIILVELLPKSYSECHAFQLVILRKDSKIVTFFDVTSKSQTQKLCPNFSYSLQLENGQVNFHSECTNSTSFQWLQETVVPQFIKWGKESTNQSICSESLALICNEKYYEKYNGLKLRYGKELVKIWPECTDPSKFVYEDVAIATYLILLWEDERQNLHLKTKQSFVDLGCGNGLLVYILTKEGYDGIGIDVRKRKIWDMYPNNVNLEEKTITPSDSDLFPETSWLIGNHSDELTPWIPVIAVRSSYKCNFFLLPCCAYNFDGSKYQRQNSGQSQYTEYLQYIRNLSETCGFKTDMDRLKIPSTKRICLIGRGRTYAEGEHEVHCNKVQSLITTSTSPGVETHSQKSWIKDFKPREATEKVRNCTQIDKKLIDSIVEKISNYLLIECVSQSKWSIGKAAELSEVVELITPENLKALKSEFGGLQTLLKNNHHIFKVQGGKVQLRYPRSVEEVQKNQKNIKSNTSTLKLKQKQCWFYKNHPQGCPLEDRTCSFLHVK